MTGCHDSPDNIDQPIETRKIGRLHWWRAPRTPRVVSSVEPLGWKACSWTRPSLSTVEWHQINTLCFGLLHGFIFFRCSLCKSAASLPTLGLTTSLKCHHILQGIGSNRPLSDLLRTLDMASIVFGSDLKLESWMGLYLSQTQEH